MYKKLSIAAGLILSVLISACKSDVKSQLEKVGDLMIEYPDSAFGMMQNIPRNAIASKEEKALFDLRMVQTRYYADKDNWNNDTLINNVLDYYRNHFDNPETPQAYYFAALINQENDNQSLAIEYFTECIIAAEKHNDFLRMALANQRLSEIYFERDQYAAVLKHQKKHYQNIQQYHGPKDKTYQSYAELEMARAYYNTEIYDSALLMIDSYLAHCDTAHSDTNFFYGLQLKGKILTKLDRNEDALQVFNKVKEENPSALNNGALLDMGCLNLEKGNIEEVRECDSILSTRTGATKYLAAYLAADKRNYKKAFGIMADMYDKENDKVMSTRRNTIQSRLDPYMELANKHIKEKEIKTLSLKFYIVFAISILVACLLWRYLLLWYRQSKKSEKLDALVTRLDQDIKTRELEISDILKKFDCTQAKLQDTRKELETTRKNLCVSRDSEARMNQILKSIDTAISQQKDSAVKVEEDLLNLITSTIIDCINSFELESVRKKNKDKTTAFPITEIKEILLNALRNKDIFSRLEWLADKKTSGLISRFKQIPVAKGSLLPMTLVFMVMNYKVYTVAILLGVTKEKVSKLRYNLRLKIREKDPELLTLLNKYLEESSTE